MQYVVTIFAVFLTAISQIGRSSFVFGDKALISPPPNMEYFSFGFQMPLADTLWIRALQDFDYCESMLAKNLCKGNGWLFVMLDSITNLAPDYRIAYYRGGLALTVIVSDYPGASRIFDKGTASFAFDKEILYAASYHALLEEKDNMKAADLLIRAGKAGLPEWTYSLAARLYTNLGKKELAVKLYEQLSREGIEPGILKRMKEKIDATK